MIKSARFTLPALLAGVMAVSPQAMASFDKEEMSVGLRLGLYNFDGGRGYPAQNNTINFVDDGFKNFVPGIQLTTPLTKHWGLRTALDFISADLVDGGSKSGYALGVDALYRFDNGMYIGPGFGSVKLGSSVNKAVRGTAGYRRAINDKLSWSGEYTLLSGNGNTDHAIMFGLIMSFGDRGPVLDRIKGLRAEEEARRDAIASTDTSTQTQATGSTTTSGQTTSGSQGSGTQTASTGVKGATKALGTTAPGSHGFTPEQVAAAYAGLPTRKADGTISDADYAPQIRAALAEMDRTKDTDGDGVEDYRDVCPNTTRGHGVDALGCSVYETESQVHHLRVTFGFDSARVPERYYEELRDLAVLVGVNPELDVLVEGHTDLIGTAEYNKALSERRANAVADILKNQYGIEAVRVNAVGHGMEKPVVNRITLDANARNRRIETTITIRTRN